MNKHRQEAKELLELEIKLARLKIEAAYLKRRKLQEREKQSHEMWSVKLAELGYDVAASGILQKNAGLKHGRLGMLLVLAGLRLWQRYGKK